MNTNNPKLAPMPTGASTEPPPPVALAPASPTTHPSSSTPGAKPPPPPHKYPKIQPAPVAKAATAAAPLRPSKKPKPVPIAVLPKPSSRLETKFNPTIKPTSSIKLKNEIGLSKKWVLPPRPRPGRKPVNVDDDDPKRSGIKDIHRGVKEMNMRDKPSIVTAAETLRKPAATAMAASTTSTDTQASDSSVPEPVPEHPELAKLKVDYLTKLKEQELINNYIEVINNQIKQLDFIKNGYISSDTLNQLNQSSGDKTGTRGTGTATATATASGAPSATRPLAQKIASATTSSMSNYQDLEMVNDFTDLERFLSYSLKSSSLIHRVTKNYQADEKISINDQIQKYLKLRASFKQTQSKRNKGNKKLKSTSMPPPDPGPVPESFNGLNNFGSNLLTENNLFDKLIINDFNDVSATKACAICSKSTCFCLDTDKKYSDSTYR